MNAYWTQQFLLAKLEPSAEALARLDRFLELLLDANKTLNLTRIVDRASAEIHHVADALTLLPHIPTGTKRLVDVGSGGGVPGIPLAIALPHVQVTLIESTRKKCAFLRKAAEALQLANVEVVDRRAEKVGRSDQRELSDLVVARAVGSLAWLAEWCLPLVRVGGKLLAMKGARAQDELAAAAGVIRLLGGAPPVIHAANLPGTDHHVIIEVVKVRKTPAKYPRDPTATGGKSLAVD